MMRKENKESRLVKVSLIRMRILMRILMKTKKRNVFVVL